MTQPTFSLDALLDEIRPALFRHRTRVRRRLFCALTVIAAGATATVAVGATYGHWLSSPSAFRTVSKPFPLPTFSGADLITGKHISNASIAGRSGFILFWQTYCPPCNGELSAVADFAKTHRAVPVIGFDMNDLPKQAVALLKKLKAESFPSISVESSQEQHHAMNLSALEVRGFPTILAFNKEGNVVAVAIGYGGTIASDLIAQEAERLG